MFSVKLVHEIMCSILSKLGATVPLRALYLVSSHSGDHQHRTGKAIVPVQFCCTVSSPTQDALCPARDPLSTDWVAL